MTKYTGFMRKAITLAAVTCGIFGLAGASQAGGTCSTAMIEEAFVLPEGTVYPAGKLTLCRERAYSPVASLHEARVDGMPFGALTSRHEKTETLDVTGSLMLFVRKPGGSLQLIGYTREVGDATELYSFVPPSVTTNVGAFLPRALAGLATTVQDVDGAKDAELVLVPAL